METILAGASNYVTTLENVTEQTYEQYGGLIKEKGYQKYAENCIDDSVRCITYIKGSRIINAAYFRREQKATISIYEGPEPIRLLDAKEQGEEKASLHMLELFRLGNSFVFQLPNGHFVISDGGLAVDLAYLLDYLESLVPEGEKPIIDGWFITHGHGDHCGNFCHFSKNTEWIERVIVEGVYYSEPNEEEVLRVCGCDVLTYEIKWVTRRLRNQKGERTELYRPQTGQRYYFCGMTADILLAQEQVPFGRFRSDLNTSSTVCMYTYEGQKLFFTGDIQEEGLEWMMQNYSKEYLKVDFFTLNHHGMNLSQEFAEYATADVMLLTVRGDIPLRGIRQTKTMLKKSKESVVWGDGTKVFPLPYQIGNYKTMPPKEWIYNEGQERIPQNNLYTCYGKHLEGWIFDADHILFQGEHLEAGAEELLRFLKEKGAKVAAFSREHVEELREMQNIDVIIDIEETESATPYLDSAQMVEQLFDLDHIYKYVVVTDSIEVVREVITDGFKTLVPMRGKELEPEIALKRWHRFDNLENIYNYFEEKQIYFTEGEKK